MKLAKLPTFSRPLNMEIESPAESGPPGIPGLALDAPVFILACPRSGSTLLRVLLDAHPVLACPPETNIAQWCVQLWSIWSLLDPDCRQEKLTEEAMQHIHSMVSGPLTAYLRHRGKSRWCDKSLGTVQYAQQLAQIYEKAKFICLHRHAMDVINSGLEATPWGLNGYGYERYSGSPNTVSALAESWIESTARSLTFEEAHSDACVRVRYEQLVADPEGVMNSVFDFLGVRPVPDIARSALAMRPIERYEVGDHKIRTSGQISTASVGSGIRVPSHLLPEGQLKVMNHLLGRLGYVKVDRAWRTSMTPPAVMAASDGEATEQTVTVDFSREQPAGSAGDPRGEVFVAVDTDLRRRISRHKLSLPPSASGWTRAAIAAYSATAPRIASVWIVDRASGSVNASVNSTDLDASGADWAVSADIDTWHAVLSGKENMAKAIRQGYIRFIGRASRGVGDESEQTDPSMGIADTRLQAMIHLLGLASGHD